ncbi:hypothetical protein [Trinickia mobilis]|uniref:hypothetical protein n=1 Tax=Trinickia mobilis TaxID=2816356 RepID=UPI001A8DBBD6|nr:hypothetical protein [Trinickia mobilis]
MANPTRRFAAGLTAIAALCSAGVYPSVVPAQESRAASGPSAYELGAVVETTARVVHIDAATNTVSLKGPRGNIVDVQVDPAVADVGRLARGDRVHISYRGALLISAEKTASGGIRSRVETQAVAPASGGQVQVAHHVVVVATVQTIDLKKRQVTLRGPQRTVTIDVSSDVPLEKLRVGDSIRAEYTSAVAVQVTRVGTAMQ